VFHASVALRDKGILTFVEASRQQGRTILEVAEAVNLPLYGTRVLMEAGLGIGLLLRRDGQYLLSKTGHIFLNQPMARINTDFMRDVCYESADDISASVMEGKPIGLQHLGLWDTIYQGLAIMPEPAKSSWFAFDHFYSDLAFPEILPLLFEDAPTSILDIGANTGRWALACLNHNENVHMGLLDLQPTLDIAKNIIDATPHANRVSYHAHDMLHADKPLPKGYEVIFMSQFLDCFSDTQIIAILRNCYDAINEGGRVIINETFWDCQKFEASAFSLQMTSLYFTTMANGDSQMYDSEVYLKLIDETGFRISRRHDNIGLSHTILELVKK